MEYQELIYKIFGEKRPRSLRTLFDVDSNEWHDTTLDRKAEMLSAMIKFKPIDYWKTEYEIQYQNTHPHILKCLERSIELIEFQIERGKFNSSDLECVVQSILANIQINDTLGREYHYSSLFYCVIDSIFSIGARYQGVQNVIDNVSAKLDINITSTFENGLRQNEITTSTFLSLIQGWTDEQAAKELYKNNQRTSTTNGILKATATKEFLVVLVKYNVETFEDLKKVLKNNSFETDIKAIKGQSSGISLKYFYMLAGDEDTIKPDRMIIRFLENTLSRNITIDEAQGLLFEAAAIISLRLNKSVTAKTLDNNIWQYQRQKKEKIEDVLQDRVFLS